MNISLLDGPVSEYDAASMQRLILQLNPKYPPQVTPEYVISRIQQPGNKIFIACNNDHVICGLLVFTTLRALSGDKAWIEDVVVDEAHRSQGIGRELLEACITEARNSQVTHINLTVRSDRAAAKELYISSGFQKNDTHYYRLVLS